MLAFHCLREVVQCISSETFGIPADRRCGLANPTYRLSNPGFYRIAKIGHSWDTMAYDAKQRLKILTFWQNHGTAAGRDFGSVNKPQPRRPCRVVRR